MGGAGASKLEQDFEKIGAEIPEELIGFENKSNICYANSVLQSLYFCREFREKILSETNYHPESLLATLKELFSSISLSKKKTGILTTRKFMNRLRQKFRIFNNDDHHDSHEFLITLLSELDEEIKKYHENSWIEELFEGSFATQTKCLCCEMVTTREEVFTDLSLEVEKNSSVLSSLREFSSTEILSGPDKFHCDNCACKQEAEKRTLIKKLPNVLICHLKRFKYAEHLRMHTKLSCRVAFPKELRLMNVMSDCEDRLYELFAIVIHLGPGFEYGHYMAIVKSHGHWIRFDDEYVERADDEQIEYVFGTSRDLPSACGYLLFYRAAEGKENGF